MLRLLCSLATLAVFAACGGTPPPPPPAAAPGKRVDAATAGSVNGRVMFTGARPAVDALKITGDPVCLKGAGPNPQSDAILLGADGAVKNAFVYIKDGLDSGYGFDVPTQTVVLDQVGCLYTPRVVGLQVGQTLEVVNSDETLHNVHSLPMKNVEFNKGQPLKGMRMATTFTVPEVPVRFMCNVHNWMAAWVGVVAHPYFAVTDASGAFEFKNVPPGKYTVEAWHEKFGTTTGTVTISDKQSATMSFAFTAIQ